MRVALVTGATSAIGRACATALAKSGVAVALPLSDHAQHVAREIRASTGGHVKSLAGETRTRWSTPRGRGAGGWTSS